MQRTQFRRLCVFVILTTAVFLTGGCNEVTRCVVEGALVATPDGDRAIETLHVGDPIWTVSAEGELERGQITAVHPGRASEFVALQLNGSDAVNLTPSHLVLKERCWIQAGDLRAGDLVGVPQRLQAIESVERVRKSVNVFDLTVTPNNTYLVGAVVVHNKSFAPGITSDLLNQPWTFETADYRWWIELSPHPRAARPSHLRQELQVLEVLSWELEDRYQLEIVLQGRRPALIEIDATYYWGAGRADVREHGKRIGKDVPFRPVASVENDYRVLQDAVEKKEPPTSQQNGEANQ